MKTNKKIIETLFYASIIALPINVIGYLKLSDHEGVFNIFTLFVAFNVYALRHWCDRLEEPDKTGGDKW